MRIARWIIMAKDTHTECVIKVKKKVKMSRDRPRWLKGFRAD